MHVPDAYLTDPVSAATAATSAAVLTAAAVRARRTHAPGPHPALAGATTAAVFGLQMLNYPVAAGTSGHLLGGALAAALLGPVWGMASVTLVLVVQAVVFADGGLSALGTNTLLLAVVGTLVGWVAARGTARLLGRRTGDERVVAPAAAAVGGAAGVLAAAAVFVGLYALGGTVAVPTGALAAQVLGVHALVAVGEAVLTGAVVAVLVAVRPGVLALTAPGPTATPQVTGGGAVARPVAVLGGLAGLAALALSSVASSAPDALEATAARVGFAGAARDHALAGLPLADYGAAGDVLLPVAGGVGVLVCAALALALVAAARPRTAASGA